VNTTYSYVFIDSVLPSSFQGRLKLCKPSPPTTLYHRDEFRVCVTSQLALENIEEFLFGIDPGSSATGTADSSSGWPAAHVGNLPNRDLFKIISIIPDKTTAGDEEDDSALS